MQGAGLRIGETAVSSESETAIASETVSAVLTTAGMAVGTIAYMSPEQARGEELDQRTDIFSFGAVLYEMATGKPAFHGKTSAVVFKAILDETPTPLPHRNPFLPQRLNEVVSKALEKDRNLRYQSAAELRTDLQRLKRDCESGTVALPTPSPQSFLRLSVVGGLVAILLAAAVIGLYRYFRNGEPAGPTNWEQMTFFTDSAVYPALSPDGRMLAFIRGGSPFFGRGDLYVRLLPSGDAVQLTHDSMSKLAPEFSPDGSRIVYGTVTGHLASAGPGRAAKHPPAKCFLPDLDRRRQTAALLRDQAGIAHGTSDYGPSSRAEP